jgi:succinate-semialdehyde dehydrogenase/glutarate-semialdehyde dehydrogenase
MQVISEASLCRDSLFIDGQWCGAASGKTFAVTNPADNSLIGHVADAAVEDVRRAIDSAHTAQTAWGATTAKYRSDLLYRWYGLMLEHKEALARLLTREQGKVLAEARTEIEYGASFVQWFAEEAKRVYGDVIPGPNANTRIVVVKQPVGVVAAITPWNFPNAMLTRKAAAAFAAGCTLVSKPASQTPLSILAIAYLAQQAGFPAGVFNVVTGRDARSIGTELSTNARVRKLTFTGSTEVGKQLMAQCAGTVKKVSMELGGNAPFIVFDDADLDAAVKGAIVAKYRNSGQTCVCANRLLVQESVAEAFTQKLIAAVKTLKLGNGLDGDVTLGPLISEHAVQGVRELLDDAVERGAKVLLGDLQQIGGAFFPPMVLADVTPQMRMFREEIFGPIAPIITFKTEAEAVALANDTEFGLASYFYGRDIGRVWRVAEQLEYGMVGINEGAISNAMAPFGGVKESGVGREGSRYGLDEYLEIKYLCLGGV